jgi:hypothetical protein
MQDTKQCAVRLSLLKHLKDLQDETSNVETQFVDKKNLFNHPHFSINKSGQSHVGRATNWECSALLLLKH